MTLPLEGKRVIDLSFALSGPWCAQIMGALGADVIKIEPLEGDETRLSGPVFWGEESPLFLATNNNKRSVAVNLADPAGQALVRELCGSADIFIQNLRLGVAERLGLGYEEVREANPGIVYCAISAFGRSGPMKDRPAYDLIMQGVGGIMSTTGEPDGRPLRAGPPVVDLATGLWAAIGVLGAAIAAAQDGKGRLVDTSLFEAAVNYQPIQFASYAASGEIPPRLGRSGNILVPFEVLATADTEIVLAAGNNRLFARACAVLDRPELAEDPRFRENADRVENRLLLTEILAGELARETTDTWLERFVAAGVPAGKVNDIADIVADPQFEALGIFAELEHPEIDDLRLIAPPVSLDGERLRLRTPAPALGADTVAVLRELGVDEERLERLRDGGVVGSA